MAILLGGGWLWLDGRIGSFTLLPSCRATALGNSTSLDPEQAGNAATIAAVAVQRGLPGRAATIGIATAIQESKLRNLDYGDRDSIGLFQQRPSQGWGTLEQIMDPVYATNAFYDVLVKVEGYQSLPITQAAQKVQRSAFPSAYADHEAEARIFASALAGHSEALAHLRPAPGERSGRGAGRGRWAHPAGSGGASRPRGPRPDGAALRPRPRIGVVPGTSVRFVLTGDDATRLGWALAQWAVARADGLAIESVAVAGQRWSRDSDGWVADPGAPPPGDRRGHRRRRRMTRPPPSWAPPSWAPPSWHPLHGHNVTLCPSGEHNVTSCSVGGRWAQRHVVPV